jgi:citrate lyase beta subunit
MSTVAGLRSLLFVPCDDADRAYRAFTRGADAIILDLEDGVAPTAKDAARDVLIRLGETEKRAPLFVRPNGLDTSWGKDDRRALEALSVDGIVVPKAEPAGLAPWAALFRPIIAIVETAIGLRGAHELACLEAVEALMLGAADLGAELGVEPRADGLELLHARSSLVTDSAAAGIRAPFDGVCLELRDRAVIEAEARLARSLGFGGKACVHPAQIEPIHEVFAIAASDVADARAVVDAFETAVTAGRGVTTVNGRMVDLPVVRHAQATLAKAGCPPNPTAR